MVATEAERTRRFRDGLDFNIQKHIAAHQHQTFSQALDAARVQEQLRKRKKALQRPHAVCYCCEAYRRTH
jgi:hypothetical protein